MAMSQPATGEAGTPASTSTDQNEQPLIAGKSEDQHVSDFNSRFQLSKSHFDEWRTEARMLYDLVAGRQWDPEDEARMKDEMRPMVTFNFSGKYMDVMQGLLINNRQDIRFYPREQGDAKVNELMTGAVTWGADLCHAAEEEREGFYDSVLTGMGWMEGYLDTDLEPDGVPARQRVDNMEMFPDPAARKANLLDMKWCIRVRFVDHEEYAEIMGEEYSGDDSEMSRIDTEDDGIQIIEEPQDYDKDANSATAASGKRRKCAVADYQFWRKEDRYIAAAPGAPPKELTPEEYAAYQPFFVEALRRGAPMRVKHIRRKVYYRLFIANGKVSKKSGLSPYQKGFTHHCITAKRDRNRNTWYGVGRALIDPQRWVNTFFSSILYAIMTNAKGGVMAELGAFKDARRAESEWSDPSKITWMKEGALSNPLGPKIQPKPAAQYPQGMDRLMEFCVSSMPNVTGMPVELMGLTDRQQPGVVEAQRKQSAMSIVAGYFDSMRSYYRSVGRQMAQYVVDYIPEGTLVLVNGESSRQYIPLLKSSLTMTFDCIVDEAPTSTNQMERTWLALQALIPQALGAGIPIPPSIIKYAPIPEDLISEWMKLLQGDPEKEQYTRQQAETNLRKLLADVLKTQSEAAKNESQVQLNQANAQKALAQANESGASSKLKTAQAFEHAAHAGAAQAQGM